MVLKANFWRHHHNIPLYLFLEQDVPFYSHGEEDVGVGAVGSMSGVSDKSPNYFGASAVHSLCRP